MDENPFIGRPLRRKEDARLLRGQGRYLPDLTRPGMLHMAFARSPHAHARVTRVDTRLAAALPGVAGVFTAADLRVRDITVEFSGPGYHAGGWPVLAGERVRFAGEPVAAVAAADRYLAEDAADLVEVDYEPLPAVASVEAARRVDAPRLHDVVPGNIYFRRDHQQGDVDGIFAAAPVVVRGVFRHQRVAGAPMEGRGIIAECDPRGRLTVRSSTQVPHLIRTGLARSLDLAESAIRVIAPDVGGGFGPKMHLYPEEVAACAVARRLRRPVKWVEDRRENLLAMTQAREQTIEAAVAADRDGRLLALQADVACDSGAHSVFPLTAALEPMGTAQIMPGPYRTAAYRYTTMAVATNKCPIGAYRGVGMTVGVFVMERLIDKVAAALGLDPADVRRRNFIEPGHFPYTAPTGLVYDSGRFEATLAAALERFDYERARAHQARARRAGQLVGIGVSAFTEYTGMGPTTFARRGMLDVPGHDAATVKVDSSGQARVYVSCPSQGQGLETVFAQLVAGELGLEPAAVAPVDTDTTPGGSGTFASRAVVAGGGALVEAAAAVKTKAAAIAARLLEAAPGDIAVSGGRFHVRGAPERGATWAEIARAARASAAAGRPAEVEGGLEATSVCAPPPAAFSNGVHAAMVEVDRDTGEVKILRYVIAEDCGPVINPLMVDGQTRGGLAQGVGEALLEEIVYEDGGQPLTSTFMDYLVPTAMEVPDVATVHLETPSPNTVRGFKGMGESAVIGSPACLANAVSDAIGAAMDVLPMTPERVLDALRRRATSTEALEAVRLAEKRQGL
jgi:carbon-monoxide dehydrogenase large subunit